ncbi:Random slug protein 5 [Schistosoma japonicum]|nr:Random slug protein 5 [Schistosoma japonicum]
MSKKSSSKTSIGGKSSTNDLTPEQIKSLKAELYQLAKNNLKPLPMEPDFATCDDTLTRFLVARNYVVNDAYEQLKTAVEWRREFQPLTVQCKWCHETPGFHSVRQIGFDREGRPVMYACFAQCQTLKNSPDDVICHMVYLIEHAKRSIQTSVNNMIFIIDCTGFTLSCCNLKIGKKFIHTFANCYPEVLYQFILINHSRLFHSIWRTIKCFIDPNTVKKVKLLRKDKFYSLFNKMFNNETVQWLLDEITLNQKDLTEIQLKFWQYNTIQSNIHDPRGTQQYIQQYIEPLNKLLQLNKQWNKLDYHNLSINVHMPHPNIMDCINHTLKLTNIKQLYNEMNINLHNNEQINENTTEISDESEE